MGILDSLKNAGDTVLATGAGFLGLVEEAANSTAKTLIGQEAEVDLGVKDFIDDRINAVRERNAAPETQIAQAGLDEIASNPDLVPQPATVPQEPIKLGDSGEHVRRLQELIGIPEDKRDGIFGPETQAALERAERQLYLPITGIATPEVLQKLEQHHAMVQQARQELNGVEMTDATHASPNNTPVVARDQAQSIER